MPLSLCHVNKTTGRFPGNKKSDTMKPEDIYNGLEYTTREINRTFKIKVNGLFNGKTNVFIPIDHAFNRVGNKYIDITFEFALGFLDPTQYEYVAFGEYPAGVIEEITDQTGYYGNIYRFCYCAAQMALEKMNPRT